MNRNPLLRQLANVLKYASVGAVALLACELFLNLIISPTIEKSLGFTDGINTDDRTFGFVYTPYYRGWMRHVDNVFLTPLVLDKYGFRLPAKSADSRQNVVIIGGRSMMFSYGLTDAHVLHRQIGETLKIPSTVYNTAWPGFDVYRNFYVYRQRLGNDIRPDFAIVAFYQDTIERFAKLPPDPSRFDLPPQSHDEIFHFFDHIAIDRPKGVVASALGRLYYRSMIGYKLGLRLSKVEDVVASLLHSAAASAPKAGTDDAAVGARRFQELTHYLQTYFGGKDKVLFVFLPGTDWSNRDTGPDYYAPLVAALPAGAHYLDVNRLYGDQVRANGYIAWGHYIPASTALIGRAIGASVNSIQGTDSAFAGTTYSVPEDVTASLHPQ